MELHNFRQCKQDLKRKCQSFQRNKISKETDKNLFSVSVGCQMRHFQLTPLLCSDILQELYFLHQQYFFRLPVTFYNVISFTPSGFWSCKSIMCPKPLWNSIWIFKPPDLTRYFTNFWFYIKSYKGF